MELHGFENGLTERRKNDAMTRGAGEDGKDVTCTV